MHKKPAAAPSHILLLDAWKYWPAGKVLAADHDLLAQLDAEQVKYRAATQRERDLAGVAD
jgi:hypothetical protein